MSIGSWEDDGGYIISGDCVAEVSLMAMDSCHHDFHPVSDRCLNCGMSRDDILEIALEELTEGIKEGIEPTEFGRINSKQRECYHDWRKVGCSPISGDDWWNCNKCDISKEDWAWFQKYKKDNKKEPKCLDELFLGF